MDGLMVDRLYGELEPSRRAAFDEHLQGCARCAAEQAALEGTRVALRQLPDEEPPPGATAFVLHEAARRTGVGRSGGWRAGLFRPLVAHPAAAAFASVVLLVGVVGVLHVRGGLQATHPERGPALPAAADAVTASPAPAAAPSSAAAPAPPTAPAATVADADDGRPAELLDDARDGLLRKKAKSAAPTKGQAAERRAAREAAPPKAEGKFDEEGELAADGESDTRALAQAEAAKDNYAQPPPAAAPTFSAELAAGGAAQAGGEPSPKRGPAGAAADKPAPSSRSGDLGPWLRTQVAALERAGRAGRCAEVATIASDVRDRDPAFYARSVARSRAAVGCDAAIEREQARRRAKPAAPAAEPTRR